MSQIIPLRPLASQQVQCQLNGQACTINVYQQAYGLFVDLFVGPPPAVQQGMIGQNLNRMVRSAYLGFAGDLVFWDTQGEEDPVFTGLGSRWQLVYLDPADLALVPS